MAYSKLPRENQLYSSGQGMAGNSSNLGGQQKTTAGTPAGFTNIQNYLQANKGANATQNYLQNKGDQQMESAQKQAQSAISGLTNINNSPTFGQDQFQNMLNTNDYEGLKKAGTPQQFTDTKTELPEVSNPLKDIKPNLEGVMSYIGQIKPQSQSYTPGMQKFDEMLLRGDNNFAENYISDKNNQYLQSVQKPLEEARAKREQEKADQQKNVNDWRSNMSNYLGGTYKQAQDIYNQQAGLENKFETLTPQQKYDAIKGAGAYSDFMSMRPYGLDPANYITRSGNNAPTMGTAAYALGQDTVNDYNTLNDIIGGYQGLSATEQFNPGSLNFNEQSFNSDYQKAIDDYRAAHQGQVAAPAMFAPGYAPMQSTPVPEEILRALGKL